MRRAAFVAGALALGAAVALGARGVERPNPAAEAQADGCNRNALSQFAGDAPEWVYVGDRNAPATSAPPPPQWARGVVSSGAAGWDAVHPTGVDGPTTHRSYDLTFNVRPDADSSFLLGGDPSAKTGNFAGGGESGEAGGETARLHVERESGSFPSFAWPEPGDRVAVHGSWIWDCGHWTPGGERTEIHPLDAIWVEHRPSPGSPTGESEGDVYASTDPTVAGKIEDCAHRAKADRNAFKACLAAAPAVHDVSGIGSFFLAAPPRPSPGARLRWRVVDRGSTGGLTLRVRPGARGVTVEVQDRAAGPGLRPAVLAKQVFVGWTPTRGGSLPEHLRLSFERLLVRRAMDPGCPAAHPSCPSKSESTRLDQVTTSPGEWTVYWDVAGIWSQWKPAVLRARDGQSFPGRQTVDFYVRRGSPWRLLVFARECDFGSFGAIRPCPAGKEVGAFAGDDVPGPLVVRFRSPAASVGVHRADALLEGSTCPRSNRRGCYALTFRVSLVRDARRRGAGYGFRARR